MGGPLDNSSCQNAMQLIWSWSHMKYYFGFIVILSVSSPIEICFFFHPYWFVISFPMSGLPFLLVKCFYKNSKICQKSWRTSVRMDNSLTFMQFELLSALHLENNRVKLYICIMYVIIHIVFRSFLIITQFTRFMSNDRVLSSWSFIPSKDLHLLMTYARIHTYNQLLRYLGVFFLQLHGAQV